MKPEGMPGEAPALILVSPVPKVGVPADTDRPASLVKNKAVLAQYIQDDVLMHLRLTEWSRSRNDEGRHGSCEPGAMAIVGERAGCAAFCADPPLEDHLVALFVNHWQQVEVLPNRALRIQLRIGRSSPAVMAGLYLLGPSPVDHL